MMRYWVAWFAVLFVFNIVPAGAQENLNIEVIGDPLYNQDTNTVTVDIVVNGEASLELTNLTPANFDIGEPFANLSVVSERRLPIAISIIVDLSVGSDDDIIRDTLKSYFINYYQPDDEVTLYILDGKTNSPRIEDVDSLATAMQIIDTLEQQDPFYFVTDALRLALNNLIVKGSSPVRPRVALHISSLIARPDEVTASVDFAREGIPLYVVQAHRLRDQQAPLFRRFATNGGGIYSNNKGGTFVLNEVDYQAVNTLKVLFDTIDNTRLVYKVSYVSRNQSLSEIREVPLTLNATGQLVASTSFSYSRTFNPPQIEFANTADLNVNRVPFRDEDGKVAFSRNTQTVTIKPIYSDGIDRTIASMRFEVFDAGTDNILQSTLTSDLTPTIDGMYVLTWNLDDFNVPDTVRDLQVRVTAFDELGLTATTERPATVSVASAPALPTPTPTPIPTATPEQIVDAEPTPILSAPINITNNTNSVVNSPVQDDSVGIFIFAILVLLLVIVILLVRVWRFSRDGVQMMNPDGTLMYPMNREDIVPNNLDDMHTPTPEELAAMESMEEEVVLAQLIITKGFDSAIFESRIINITSTEFLVGRVEDDETDLVINVPYVSPRHCVIIITDGQQYTVRDLSSKNGTYVNDERVADDKTMPAPLGSEIGITKRITMEIWDANMVLDLSRFDRDGDGDDDAFDVIEEAEFQPLPGLKYVDDDGDAIDPDYEPI